MAGSPSPLVIKGLASAYNAATLQAARTEAAAALLAEKDLVVLESISMEGGGGSGRALEGNPERVMALIQAALDYQTNNDASPAMASAMRFNARRVET